MLSENRAAFFCSTASYSSVAQVCLILSDVSITSSNG